MLKSINRPKARKNYECDGCPNPIEKGQYYALIVILDLKTNRHITHKYHADCYERHQKAEEDYLKNEMREDHLGAMRSFWDGAYQ